MLAYFSLLLKYCQFILLFHSTITTLFIAIRLSVVVFYFHSLVSPKPQSCPPARPAIPSSQCSFLIFSSHTHFAPPPNCHLSYYISFWIYLVILIYDRTPIIWIINLALSWFFILPITSSFYWCLVQFRVIGLHNPLSFA